MNKTALVTGASSGIGRETALLLNEHGYTVYAAARRKEKMTDLAAKGIRTLYMDVEMDGSMVEAVRQILAEQDGIDVLVNNAGYGIYGTVEDVPMSEARRQFDVNVFGLARMCQLVLPSMRERGRGRIVNISSVAGRMSIALGAWYHASKHAVEAISDSLRNEVKDFGIQVVIVEPGIIDTAWWPIAEKNLERVSGTTAYPRLVEQGKKYLNDPGKMTDPLEVAVTIVKAVRADEPKVRYLVGSMARTIVLAKDYLPDRMFDSMTRKQMEREK